MVVDGAYFMGGWVGGVCTPSRTMMMSGRTLWHVPDESGRGNNPHHADPVRVPPDLANHTVPAVFNRAGYATMRTCKPGNSYQAANRLFQVRQKSPTGSWSFRRLRHCQFGQGSPCELAICR